jgi:SAM-dependent methyltransferase
MNLPDPHAPFDPRRVRAHRARAAKDFTASAFLAMRAASDLAERLEIVNRSFGLTLAIGAPDLFRVAVTERPALAERVGAIVGMDSVATLARDVAADAEALPFVDGQFGLIVSNLTLHWANDLPGALVQARRALRPDGLFIASLLGGRSLSELRECLLAAELDLRGGAGPRVSPTIDAPDLGRLLQRAGFALPVADSDTVMVRYENPLRLLSDLRAMGETNALTAAERPLTRAIVFRAMELYRERFGGDDGRVRATFEIVTATGWAPHESQQKPLRPGSAKTRLADALGVKEQNAGEKAGDQ